MDRKSRRDGIATASTIRQASERSKPSLNAEESQRDRDAGNGEPPSKAKRGYFIVPREFFDHPAFQNATEQAAFMWLLGKAQWHPERVRYKERLVDLERGQLALSLRDLARTFGWSIGTAQRFLARAKFHRLITTESRFTPDSPTDTPRDSPGDSPPGTGVTVINISNYAIYQGEPERRETPRDSPSDSPRDSPPNANRFTEQSSNQGIKESPSVVSPKGEQRAKPIPDGWTPPPIAELPPKARKCASQWPVGAYEREAEGFASYWRGRGSTMKDWRATWANSVIRFHSEAMREVRDAGSRRDPSQPMTATEFLRSQKARAAQ